MQQLDALTLKALAAELQGLLDNARVSKVQHPSAQEFLITFWGGPLRGGAQQNLLYIQLNPEAPFCALTPLRHRQDTALHTFAKPTALCMLLRKLLGGASLQAVQTLPGERVLNLAFENFNELGNKVRLVLSLELMGKHSNMVLYDAVQGVLLAVAHGVSDRMSSRRELAAGLPYAPPPPPAGKQRLAQLTQAEFIALCAQQPPEEQLARFLTQRLAGWGQRMAEDAVNAHGEDPARLYPALLALEAGESLSPAMRLDGSEFTLLPQPQLAGWQAFDSVNNLVTAYFTGYWQSTRMRRRTEQLGAQLAQRQKKLDRRTQELAPVTDAEIQALQATGDRLLAAFSAREVPPQPEANHGQVTLTRYEDGAPWPVAIDPTLSWVENAQVYYRRAKKAKARRTVYHQMVDVLQAESEYLASLRQLVGQADTLRELDALEAEIAAASAPGKAEKNAPPLSKKQREKKEKDGITGVVSLRTSDGLEVLLGKSGQGNDAIVGKLSRSEDWWLHVHQMPGSHVLVRTGEKSRPDSGGHASGLPLPPQSLLEAAMLAVHYSAARHSVNVPVIYTQSKHVRKIPQSYPGHVNYKQERTVFITPDPAVLSALTAGFSAAESGRAPV